MNKKIILVNIFIIILLLVIAEFSAFAIRANSLIKEGVFNSDTKTEFLKKLNEYYFRAYREYKSPPYTEANFRPIYNKKSTKGDIVLFGCSYTYGFGLNDNETFSYILSNFTNRMVYNLGISSSSPREILYLLRDRNFLSKFIKNNDNIEYVIYTFTTDHLRRLYYNLNEFAHQPDKNLY